MYNEARGEDVRHVLVAALCVCRVVRRARRMCAQISGRGAPLGAHADDGVGATHSYVITARVIYGLGRPHW